MNLIIDNNSKLSDIKKQFSDVYPFLKIEFFKKPHAANKLSADKDKISGDKTLSTVAKLEGSITIEINKNTTVNELEKDFWNKFRLSVQVFRKSMDMWIETSLTDAWTLERQNSEGEFFSTNENVGTIEEGFENRRVDME